MSLSRPARFPLLKLPWLCIECVIKRWNIVDIIFFALISKKTRRFVKYLKIPLNGVLISERKLRWMMMDKWEAWLFKNTRESFLDEQLQNSSKYPLVLQKNSLPLYTSKTDSSLKSYFDGNEMTALKMAMEFLDEMFKCTVRAVQFHADDLPESGDIGVRSIMNMYIMSSSIYCSQPFGYAQSKKLNLLLENLEVTDSCNFGMNNTTKDFSVDPKLFKCKQLVFSLGSAAWVTREILMQFEVPRLTFLRCPFSVEDIISFVTNWFHSDNNTLEYFDILYQDGRISLENFQTKELNPVPISERNRVPLSESYRDIDFSKGLEIVRNDGLHATIHVERKAFLFYIWHN